MKNIALGIMRYAYGGIANSYRHNRFRPHILGGSLIGLLSAHLWRRLPDFPVDLILQFGIASCTLWHTTPVR